MLQRVYFGAFLMLLVSFNINAQHYQVHSDESPKFSQIALRFEIRDSRSHRAIKNAKVTFYFGDRKYSEAYPDKNGVVAYFFEDFTSKPLRFKITAPKYEYWEKTWTHDQLYDDTRDGRMNNLSIPTSKVPREFSKMFRFLSEGNYATSPNRSYPTMTSTILYENEVNLRRIETRHDHRPRGRKGRENNRDARGDKRYDVLKNGGKKMFVAPYNISGVRWGQAKSRCKGMRRFGYDDWRLPNKKELNRMVENKNQIRNFSRGKYWSSEKSNREDHVWIQSIHNGIQEKYFKGSSFDASTGGMKARCVRIE